MEYKIKERQNNNFLVLFFVSYDEVINIKNKVYHDYENKQETQASNSTINKQIEEAIIKEAINHFSEVEGITTWKPVSYRIEGSDKNNSLVFSAQISSLPKVILPEYSQSMITIPNNDLEVNKKDLLNALQELRYSLAEFHNIEDNINDFDRITVDIFATKDDVPIPLMSLDNFVIIVKKDMYFKGFYENIILMREKDRKKFEINLTDDIPNPNYRNEKVSVEVFIHKVERPKMADMNKNFTEKILSGINYSVLFAHLKNKIENDYELAITKKNNNFAVSYFTSKSEIEDIPDEMINSEVITKWESTDKRILEDQNKEEDIINKSKEAWLKDKFIREDICNNIKNSLVIRELVKKENIKITSEDIKTMITYMSEALKIPPEAILSSLEETSTKDNLIDKISMEKAAYFIKSKIIK